MADMAPRAVSQYGPFLNIAPPPSRRIGVAVALALLLGRPKAATWLTCLPPPAHSSPPAL